MVLIPDEQQYKINGRVKNFCKSHTTLGKSLPEIYALFSQRKLNQGITREEFELGLICNKARALVSIIEKCKQYLESDGPVEGLIKYRIEQQDTISQHIWDKAIAELKKEHKSTTPILLSTEALELDPEEVFFTRLIPTNWDKMTLPQRIDHAQKIQHKGFFDFMLKKDSQLRKYFQSSNPDRNKNKPQIYVTLFSFPAESYTQEAKGLLKCFVDILNMTGRARFQYVECSDPKVVEIREIR